MAETSWNPKSKRAPMKSVTEDPSQLQFTPQKSKFGTTQAGQTRLPAGAISEEDTPSPLEIGEIRSRAAQLKERILRLRLPSRHSTGQETAQWEEQKDLIVHKQELDEKRLLLISEQKNKIDGTVLDVKMRALWSENRLVALKRELLREENLLSISEEKGPISPKDRSKSDDIRSEIANALTNLIKTQDDLLYYQPVFWKYRFQHHSQSYLFHEVLVYAESILFILESQAGLQKGKEANKSTDEHSRINSLRRVADAQQELLNMQKMTYQEMIGSTQEKETHSQGESEEEKTELLQGMSVIRQEKGTPGQAESVKEIKQTEDASKQLELILEQTQVAAEIKREDHHVTVEEIHSHFSAMFETTLDALLLLTSSSTLTLEHLMEGFSDFFWVIGCIDDISDNHHCGWHVDRLGRALSQTNQQIVREIKKTAVAGELSPIFDVKELRFPEQKTKTLRKEVRLSEDTTRKLCEELNTESADKSFLRNLCDVGPVFLDKVQKTFEEPARAVLETFLSFHARDEPSTMTAIMYLKEIFTRLRMDRALQILNEDEAVEKLPNRLPTHLQKVLKELETNIAQIRDGESSGNVYQLPYISMGYFDSEGGRLSLEEYNVNLFVPRGAIPDGQVQQVYVYVDPDAPPMNDIDPPAIALSRMIQCGPPGLTFQKRVILSFPYHADKDITWELRVQECNNDNDVTKTWRNLDDGVLFTEDEVVVHLEHFTGERVIGKPTPDVMCAGVFGSEFDPNLDQFVTRVHVWKNEQSIRQTVLDKEQLMGCHLLDVERFFRFQSGDGDIRIDVINTSLPWRVTSVDGGSIDEADVIDLPENSVTFILTNTQENQNPASLPDLSFDVELQQNGNGRNKIFKFRRPSSRREVQVRRRCKCSASYALVLCPYCRENLRRSLVRLISVKENYGGMSEGALLSLCEVLDRDSSDLVKLAQDIFDEHRIRFVVGERLPLGIYDAMDLIAFHFKMCSIRRLSKGEAVDTLNERLKSINQEASEILDKDLHRQL